MSQTLVEKLDSVSELGFLKKDIPDYVLRNLSPKFEIREYQREALARFQFYIDDYDAKQLPIHLLFNMATGSGKTLLIASNILYLYNKGYNNFIFFVNSTTIIRKTKTNFLDKSSSKYLFADRIIFNDREIFLQEVENFEAVNQDNINIIFTTIQGLHSRLNNTQENLVTYEDFKNKKVVFLSDEAHHINTLTKNWSKMTKEEREESTSWENTISKIFRSDIKNVLLEYTATIDLSHKAIRDKYINKIIYQYTLKEFRHDKFSKDVQIIQSDLNIMNRALQAVILSQYRRKVAEKYKISLKPVVLIKSQKTIAQSEEAEFKFKKMIRKLKLSDIKRIEASSSNGIINRAFSFFKENEITYENLIKEIQEDFSEEKCLALNSKSDSEHKQIQVNTLEDEHNETRLIFTVNMLNEGWDVLNLFDIIRLYETRDTKYGRPGSTTISEAQLIGRGARYYPFKFNEEQDKFKRKYDDDINSELRVLEELHYHSLNDSRYISEIKSELVKSGIAPPDDNRREIIVAVKNKIKKSSFWKEALLFRNERQRNTHTEVKSLKDILPEAIFKYKLRAGVTTETSVFEENNEAETDINNDILKKTIKPNSFEKHINRKALDKVDFYRFSNLKAFFPSLKTIDEFISSDDYLGQVQIELYGIKERLESLNNNNKFEIALSIFKEIASKIQINNPDYIGTTEFRGYIISKIVPEVKTSDILIGGIDKEYGIAMSHTTNSHLRFNLSEQNWYIHEENYGTSEEKYLIQFIRYAMEELRKKYKDIYLLRNEDIFKIYRFSDGRAISPDFVLFLTEKETNKFLSFQLFIEAKGQHLIATDTWKEDFLKEIERKFEIITLGESDKYKLVGLPFYNEVLKKEEFTQRFKEVLNI